ncbi:MAG TPA: DUF4129 domain-containing protein [Thermoguttaceae bacterium]|nr:DUF4129 domain-containing protein [Thermoguttaceae bacterium]
MIHCLLCVAMVLALARTPPEEAVARGREALDHRWSGYPWYDATTDGARPVELDEPPEEAEEAASNDSGGEGWAALWELLKWAVWALVAVILATVVFLLVRAYFKDGDLRWARRKKTEKVDDDERRRIEALPFPVKAANLDLLDLARRFYRQGEYGEAVKYLFSYELVQLDKHRVVRLAKGKTNRQYLREVGRRGRGPLGGLLEQTMLAFEDFFFGNHAIDQTRFEACWSRLPEFEAQLKGEPT